MSLELAIQANTAAINQLIAVMSKRVAFDIETPATCGEVSPDIHETFKPIVPANATPPSPVEQPKEVIIDTTPSEMYPPELLNYEKDILPVLHKFLVAKGGRVAGEPLLKKYGVDKFSKVPVEKLGSLLVDLNEAMGA
jgi:hypothetical protein